MDSSAAADSGDCGRWAARTTDHRVGGKARGPAPVEVRLLMGACYPTLLPETRRLLQRADKDRDEKVTPNHLFRIASVSKPITSATPSSLIEAGKLRLSDKVFGPGAVLGTSSAA